MAKSTRSRPIVPLAPRRTAGAQRNRVGRPRDPRLDAAVLAATRALLAEAGYHRLSIEAIARRAGVHRPVIYRRWRSKAALVHEAVYPAGDAALRIVDTGDWAGDLRALVRNTVRLFSRPEVLSAIPGLMAEMREAPELQRALVPRLEAGAREDFARLVAGAVARGVARRSVSTDTLFDALAGTILFRIATAGVRGLGTLEQELVALLLAATGGTIRRARRR
ncbi:MAG: TetR/AcrR family transcriptional regulator [Candidatus Binatia bacterium]